MQGHHESWPGSWKKIRVDEPSSQLGKRQCGRPDGPINLRQSTMDPMHSGSLAPHQIWETLIGETVGTIRLPQARFIIVTSRCKTLKIGSSRNVEFGDCFSSRKEICNLRLIYPYRAKVLAE
jgi:hypothetical protein